MAPSIKGLAAYKKKDGTLIISNDQRAIVWQPHASTRESNKPLSIAVADITSRLYVSGHIEIIQLTHARFTTNARVCRQGDVEDLRKVT